MDLSKLKTYAPQARKEFIQAMKDRAAYYGLTATKVEPVVEKGDVAVIGGRSFPISVAAKRNALEARIKEQGFESAMEALAYTWFNRLVAIRYMELKGYLDHGYRVLSHPEDKPTPEILQYAEHVDLPGLKREAVIELKLDGNKESELYRKLLVAQCNALHRTMPFLFERVEDESELLLPDNLLHSDSLIRDLVNNLDAEDCESVEVLGWLYQFYIAEKKDTVMARKSAVPTEDIPAVTQLFTPHWIVRYLVENSLGRLWLDSRPNSRLRDHMPYFIESAPSETGTNKPTTTDSSSQPPDLFAALESRSQTQDPSSLRVSKPEEIKLVDPACGSGHMLTYAFDLLTLIYEEEGYAPTEIPALILRHNLHGLEICPRAAQLAELALVFKAREKSRRFFQPEHLVRPRIIELRDVRFAENELRDYIRALGLGDLFNQPMLRQLHQFEEAKNFGSLIQPCLDERAIADARRAIEAKDLGGQLFLRETHLKVLRVLEQAEALTQRYHVVVANPPYQEQDDMNGRLRIFIDSNYRNGNTDLCCAFMFRNQNLTYPSGFVGMITMQSWMFLVGSSALRDYFTRNAEFDSMIHLGPRAFDSIPGEVVQTTAFVFASRQPTTRPKFFRLVSGRNEREKEALFLTRQHRFDQCNLADFRRITASPFAYWASEAVFRAFEGHPAFSDCADPCQGLSTGDTPRFLRYWHEVSRSNSEFSAASSKAASDSGKKWFPIDKGGPPRRWFGNNDFIVNWFRDGEEVRNLKTSAGKQKSYARNSRFYFDPGVTWTKVSSGPFASRLTGAGFIFSDAGMKVFAKDEAELRYIACFLNSRVANYLLGFLSETINYEQGNLARLPLARVDLDEEVGIALLDNARADWDNFETSWDFRDQPLLRPGLKGATLEASWRNWEAQSTAAIRRMQALETENNRLFIAAYGLDGELQPEVPEAQITLARAEARRDMAAFLSYAVGCMMGRYSPDHPGLILANAGDTVLEYLAKVGRKQDQLTFAPDADGIIPVLEGDWFTDDVSARTKEFLRTTFGEATLAENLRFIEESLGKDLQKYFLTDFYKDHLQTYKKRPIYWLFSSGKQKAFQCLVYLHRYNEGTLARMRTEYVIPLQGRMASRIEQLEGDKSKATSTSHRNKLQKEQDALKKQQAELAAFEEKLKHYADMKITLDLDDGVKVNYAKFGDLLAESKAITGGKDDE